MEKTSNNSVMKSRTVGSAISEGLRLYMDNFKRIFRYSWPGALLYAIAAGITNTYTVSQLPRLQVLIMQGQLPPAQLISQTVPFALASLGVLVSILFFSSYGYSLLRQHLATGTISRPVRVFNINLPVLWRTVKNYLCLSLSVIIVSILVTLILGAAFLAIEGTMSRLLLLSLTTIAVLLFLLPLSYVSMRYMLTDGVGFWSQLHHAYPVGLRRLGYILAVLLVEVIAILLVNFVVSIPSVVLMSANMLAQSGIINGDAVGMPSYMPAMTLVIFTIAGFLSAYILLSVLFPWYYMYGAIEKEEEDKREAMKNLIKQ